MEYLNQLRQLLEEKVKLMRTIHSQPSWKYGGFEELVLDCGQPIIVGDATKNPLLKKATPKRCYANCLDLAFTQSDLTYVEGFVLTDFGIPIAHAWLLTADRHGIEVTLKTPGLAYWGIPFSTEWLKNFLNHRKTISQADVVSIFDGNYIERYSLLKNGLPNHALYAN